MAVIFEEFGFELTLSGVDSKIPREKDCPFSTAWHLK
jgi:hypothetical protein